MKSPSKTGADFASVNITLEPDKLTRIPSIKSYKSYEAFRKSIYYFLERPGSRLALFYHLINLVLIVGSIVISVLSTIDTFQEDPFLLKLILYYELSLLSWFSVEYLIRLWSSSFLSKYRGVYGKLRFMATLYMMIDAFVIISTLTTAILSVKVTYFSILRITRFLQIFRILRLDRQRGDLRTMGRVVYKHRKELVTCYFVGFIILFGGTYIVYLAEKGSAPDSTIDNLANGLYWAMITVTSVGYGDISPKSWGGKMITGVFALVGCAFFALPSGILGSGFALQVAKQKKQRRHVKVRNPAAIVIQSCWRNYAVKQRRFELQATWQTFFPYILKQTRKNSSSEYFEKLPGFNEFLQPDSFPHSPVSQSNSSTDKKKPLLNRFLNIFSTEKNEEEEEGFATFNSVPDKTNGTTSSIEVTFNKSNNTSHRRKRAGVNSSLKKTGIKVNPDTPMVSTMINKEHKQAIRFILRIRLFQSIKHFKNIRYPFVNVQDIMEKSALCHTETMSHLKQIQEALHECRTELNAMKKVLYGRKCAVTSLNTHTVVDHEVGGNAHPTISESPISKSCRNIRTIEPEETEELHKNSNILLHLEDSKKDG